MILSFLKALVILGVLILYFKTAVEIIFAKSRKPAYRIMAMALITFIPVIGLAIYYYLKKNSNS
jgi:hypothetical protein